MAQFPAPGPTWTVLGPHQFLDASVSTSLTIPPLTANVTTGPGVEYVAILIAQSVAQWVNFDGTAATQAFTTSCRLGDGDWVIVYGLNNLKNVRVIHDATGGSLAVLYYTYVNMVGR